MTLRKRLIQKLKEQEERYPDDLHAVVMRDQLFRAAEDGDIKQVKMLIDQGADVNVRNIAGWTPLHVAAYKRHEGIVKLLKQHGAKE